MDLDTPGTLSECLTQEDAYLEDISNFDYPASWRMTMDPNDSCYHLVFQTAYATWKDD